MADDLRRGEESEREGAEAHLPSPTIWPFGFAAGLALVLIGLIVSWPVVAVGAGLTIVFGFLWIREVTREVRGPVAEPVPPAAVAVHEGVEADEDEPVELERYTRSRFLEGSTLGLGALIGGIVTAPVAIFAVAPAFVGQGYDDVDLGPLENYPPGEWLVVQFPSRTDQGTVGRRTAFVRNNGLANGLPSFTIISNRCVHLGCPTAPQGPSQESRDVETEAGMLVVTPTQPSGFGCPCHGGAYSIEGNRTAGPPVRALDRYRYAIRDGRLLLGEPYSVASVEGEGAEARIAAYDIADPGLHLDGPEQIFYPYIP